MDVESIKNVVIRQREEIEDLFEREKIIGRSGKSVLSWQLAKDEEFAYINLFDERLSGMKTADLDRVIDAFYELYSPGIESLYYI